MSKALKIGLIVILSFLAIAGSIALFGPNLLNNYFKTALIEEFEKQTEQKYTLNFSSFDIGIFRRSISLDSISVQPDSVSPFIRKIEVSSISLNGIKWRTLLRKKFPDFASIVVTEPEVELFTRDYTATDSSNAGSTQNAEIVQNLSKFDLIIEHGSGKLVRKDRTEVLVIGDISLEAKNVDVNALLNGSELFFLEDLSIKGSGLKWSLVDKLYEFTISDFSFDKNEERVSFTDIALTPVVPKYRFSYLRAYQLDRIHLEIPSAVLSGFKLDSLFEEHLEIDSLQIQDAWLEVFRNKQIDRSRGISTKPLLNKVAHKIDFSFGLNNIHISNSTIIYGEHKPPSDSSGSISFNDINATLTKFRTASHPDFHQDTLRLHVKSLFMDSAPLTVDVKYPVFNEKDHHSIKVRLERMDPKAVSNMLERVGFIRIEDGLVESLEAEFELNSESSAGEILVLYTDLKVSILNKDNPEIENLFQRAGDLIANTFVIKSNNTGDNPRKGKIDFEREKDKSIFGYWWKSLLSGLKDSIK